MTNRDLKKRQKFTQEENQEVNDQVIAEGEVEAEIADAGTERRSDAIHSGETWISIEGPSAGMLVSELSGKHNVRFTQLIEMEPWYFRASVVDYDPESVRLEGFSLNDGTYVSEVEYGTVSTNEGADQRETVENTADEDSPPV